VSGIVPRLGGVWRGKAWGGAAGESKEECSFLKKRTKKLLDFGVSDPASVFTK
jgi:hypothetical protein